jgi:hypothetical protein
VASVPLYHDEAIAAYDAFPNTLVIINEWFDSQLPTAGTTNVSGGGRAPKACWKPTGRKVRCRDGVVRTLHANASKLGDLRVKRVRALPRGGQEVRYVKA